MFRKNIIASLIALLSLAACGVHTYESGYIYERPVTQRSVYNVYEVQPVQVISTKRCYWMENHSGSFRWVPATNARSESDCFRLNSCGAGGGMSGGGCYKWTVSANDQDPAAVRNVPNNNKYGDKHDGIFGHDNNRDNANRKDYDDRRDNGNRNDHDEHKDNGRNGQGDNQHGQGNSQNQQNNNPFVHGNSQQHGNNSNGQNNGKQQNNNSHGQGNNQQQNNNPFAHGNSQQHGNNSNGQSNGKQQNNNPHGHNNSSAQAAPIIVPVQAAPAAQPDAKSSKCDHKKDNPGKGNGGCE